MRIGQHCNVSGNDLVSSGHKLSPDTILTKRPWVKFNKFKQQNANITKTTSCCIQFLVIQMPKTAITRCLLWTFWRKIECVFITQYHIQRTNTVWSWCYNSYTVLLYCIPGIILCMHPANERWRYNVTSSLIGWAHAQNEPCILYWVIIDCIMNIIDCAAEKAAVY